jgi:tryptophan synthase alpha chain
VCSSDLADGPTIQQATQVALENGATIQTALDAIKTLRERGVTQPMLVFSYLNPLINYGTEKIVKDAKAAGADGFIIPDLPPEEAHLFQTCAEENMALVFFLAPTSDADRIKLVAEKATGFIYVVSLTGITGARTDLPADLQDFIARLRAATDVPLVLGFGISTPAHAQMMNGLVNGFIVGSALVRAAKESVTAVHDLAQSLRGALD